MKTSLQLVCVIFALSFASPVFADELGPGKPKSNQTTTQSTTESTTTETCSLLDEFLGTCSSDETSGS